MKKSLNEWMRKLDESSRCLQMKQISSMEISPRALGHP
jgi:hypothetical protein